MARQRHLPLRRCVACGESIAKRQLIRLVHTPEGSVEVDAAGRRPGRGAYLCKREACWRQGLASPGRLERALRTGIPREACERLALAIQALALGQVEGG